MPRTEAESFVGREAELDELERRVEGGARLLTLLGPPGVGKSRLAERFAARAEASGRRVVHCDLKAASGREEMLRQIGKALAAPLPSAGSRGEGEELSRAAAAARALGAAVLILDDVDRAVGAAAEIAAHLVAEAPDLALLATSREPLRAEAETRIFAEPLPPREGAELFRARAEARGASPESLRDERAIGEITAALDGLPLALELAAARAVVLSPAQILARLEQRLTLLRAESGGEGRAGLRASIEASWELLSRAERRALAQCAAFPGPFSADAAEAVLEPGAGEGECDRPVLDILQALRERSLVRARAEASAPGRPTITRISLYESVREFAEEKLRGGEGGDPEAVRARHAAFYAERAEALAARSVTADRDDVLAELAAEEAHLWQARREAGELADRARVGIALAVALGVWGPRARQLEAAEDAVSAAREAGSERLSAQALQLCGHALIEVGRENEASPLFARAEELATSARDDPTRRYASAGLARLGFRSFRVEAFEARARALLAEAPEEEVGLRALLSARLPCSLALGGRVDEAVELAATERARARRLGSAQYEAACAMALGVCEHEAGDAAAARAHYAEAASRFRVAGPKTEAAASNLLAAWAELEAGELAGARERVAEAREALRGLGDAVLEAGALAVEGAVCLAEDRPEEAALSFWAALERGGAESALVRACARPLAALALARADRPQEAVSALSAEGGEPDPELCRRFGALGELWDLARARVGAGASADAGAKAPGAAERGGQIFSHENASPRLLRGGIEAIVSRPADRGPQGAPAERAREGVAGGGGPDERGQKGAEAEKSADVEEGERGHRSPRGAPGAEEAVLVVGARGRRIRPPGQTEWVELGRRGPVRRILLRLVEARRGADGGEPEPLSVEDLLEAGWPEERVSYEAGVARVYSAIAALRKLGLRDVLETVEGGYRISPRADVRGDRSQ